MQYHWGLGVGHLYVHQSTSCHQSIVIDAPDESISESLPSGGDMRTEDDDESDDPEMTLEDREFEDWEESDDSDGGKTNDQGSEDDDE